MLHASDGYAGGQRQDGKGLSVYGRQVRVRIINRKIYG